MSSDNSQILERLFIARLADLSQLIKEHPRLRYAIEHHQNIRGDKMTFHDKPYLFDIYCDNHPRIVLQSSVQTGKSELLIIAALSYSEIGMQVMYVLPAEDIRNKFVANRIDRLLLMVPHYASMVVKGTNVSKSRSLKHYGLGSIFFEGSNSATTFIEKPLDAVMADEVDKFDLANYAKADDRMTASPYKIKYEASNPSVDNYGINNSYQRSDQRVWMNKCEACSYWQEFDFFENVVRQTDDDKFLLRDVKWVDGKRDIHILCKSCEKPLNRFSIKGCWVIKEPSKSHKSHGYLIHQMLSAYVRIDEMWDSFYNALNSDTEMQVFYNSMLGLTYAGVGAKLTDDILNKCKEEYTMPMYVHEEPCVMGVDVGKRLNVVVRQVCNGEKLKLVFAGTIRDFNELDFLFSRFNIVSYVIDAMPETRLATMWANKKRGRGRICRYVNGLKEVTVKKNKKKNPGEEEVITVSADRTMLLDRVQKLFIEKTYVNPMNAQSLDRGAYYKQLKTPTRVYDEEKQRYDWLGDPDHYYHAEVYALLAYMCRGRMEVVGIPLGVAPVEKIPETFDEFTRQFPPNTPKHLIDHYRNIYERIKSSDKMNK